LGCIWFSIFLYVFHRSALVRAVKEQQRVSADHPQSLAQGRPKTWNSSLGKWVGDDPPKSRDQRPKTFGAKVIDDMGAWALTGLVMPIVLLIIMTVQGWHPTGLLAGRQSLFGFVLTFFCVCMLPGILVGGVLSAILHIRVVDGSYWGGFMFSFYIGFGVLTSQPEHEDKAIPIIVGLVGAIIGGLYEAISQIFDVLTGRAHTIRTALLMMMVVLATSLVHRSPDFSSSDWIAAEWSLWGAVVAGTVLVAVAATVSKLGMAKGMFGACFRLGAYSTGVVVGTLGTAVLGSLLVYQLGFSFHGSINLVFCELVSSALGGAVGLFIFSYSEPFVVKETDNTVEKRAKALWRKFLRMDRKVRAFPSPGGEPESSTPTVRIPRTVGPKQWEWLGPAVLLALSNISTAWLLLR